jgi:hypothetical protein
VNLFLLICRYITVIGFSISLVGLCIAAYWMRGASLWWRSTAAIRRGDFEESDRLARRARRWSVGVRDDH